MICLDLPSKKLTSSLAGSDASTILAVPSMKLIAPLLYEDVQWNNIWWSYFKSAELF